MKDSRTHLAVVPAPPDAVPQRTLEARSDDELMLLARGGSKIAFEALVRRHQTRVLSVAARRLGHRALAADVAQNAFLEVYRALSRYQPRGMFAAFLYRVLLNQCRVQQRRARAEARALDTVEEAASASDDAILAREWQRDVERALGTLSPKLRDVVLLRYSADLKYEEIAEALGVPVGTVKRRLFDAVVKLREQMVRR
jgi:RNA polymerase sigma-70 factor, ECF subfamily